MCATGRLEAVEKKVDPGPGDYDLPHLPGETEWKWRVLMVREDIFED